MDTMETIEVATGLSMEVKMLVAACVVLATMLVLTMAAPKKEQKLIPTIMGMATGNPPYRASQEQALQVAESCPECTSIKPVLARIYGNSRIDYRYMAVPDFTPEQRLEKFREVAVPLVTDVCARALKDAGVKAEEIG